MAVGFWRRMGRWVWRGAIALSVIAVIFAVGLFFHLRSSLPSFTAKLTLPGLNGTVEIVRDRNAIPHIFAQSPEDAYFALGFVHAQDRLWQMETMRRVGAGRMSEIVGVEEIVRLDRMMRTLGIYRRAQESLNALSPRARSALEAYARGVNAWLHSRRGALPPEFALLSHQPEPWQPADSLVWGKLMSLLLSGNWRGELLRARLAQILTPEQLADLFPGYPADGHTTLGGSGSAQLLNGLDGLLRATELPYAKPILASNEWVVSGSRSDTGKPLLANDPHLGFDIPNVFYLVRLVAPGLDLRGASSPGSPGIVLGHNGTIAWGFTTTNLDSQDLFIEKIDPTDPNRYVTPDGTANFIVRDETIKVAGKPDVTFKVRSTRHGPVISDLDATTAGAAPGGHVLSLSATALSGDDTTIEAVIELNRARNWEQFLAALRKYHGPMQNMVYADTAGNIGFIAPGRVPIRRKGDGFIPSPAWAGEYDWAGFVPFERLPQSYNPPSGVIANANARIVPDNFPFFISREWGEPYRQQRASDLLNTVGRHTIASMIGIQADHFSPDTIKMLPFLAKAKARHTLAPQAIAMLQAWDGRMARDRAEPAIYAAWLRQLHIKIYADELIRPGRDAMGQLDAQAEPSDLFRQYRNEEVAFLLHVLDEKHGWCDDIRTQQVENCEEITGAALDAALEDLVTRLGGDPEQWRWADIHQASFRHRIFGALPLIDRLANVTLPVDGGMHTLNRARPSFSDPRQPFAAIHGATYRAVYDFDNLDNSRFIMPLGQSGNPLSPWYDNLTEDWRSFRYLVIRGTAEELKRAALGVTELRPR